jgi:excisionase family DNA binding protein
VKALADGGAVAREDVQQQDTATMKSYDSELGTRPTCTVAQAAAALGCSIGKVYNLLRTRQLGYTEIGRRKLVLVESVAAYQRANTYQALLNDAGRDEPAPVPVQQPTRPTRPAFSPAPFLGRRHLR